MSHNVSVKPGKSVRLKTSGKYCDRDIIVSGDGSEIKSKTYRVTIPTLFAETDVVVVSKDPDVAAHHKDLHACVTVRKITNYNQHGIVFIIQGNLMVAKVCGSYTNYNTANNNSGSISTTVTNLQYNGSSPGSPYVRCTDEGDIIVFPLRQQNNFGGAEYLVTFSW